MVNQIEFHPGMFQEETLRYCEENGILVEAWSPLGSGRILQNIELKKIAQKYNKSVAQICLRWCIQNGVMPIAKSLKVQNMIENREVYDFNISQIDMEYINNMESFGQSGLDPDYLEKERKNE